jgi:glycosyltransferase involved in cell wall biosynthesis
VPEVSVVVITLNEASHIDDALASVAWADEIVVVDSGSTDDTVQLAKQHTDRVTYHPWAGYGAQKDHATSLASHDWVLSLDADERVTPELAAEITALLYGNNAPPHRGYRLPRTTRYANRWMRTTDWYPDYQLRLYDRRAASWSRDLVHESVRLDGPAGTLMHDIQHYAYRDLASHVATINRYTSLAADQMARDGRRAGLADLLVHPPAAFLRNYLLRRGCLQGRAGLLVSLMNSYYVFLKYAKLREQVHAAQARTGEDR